MNTNLRASKSSELRIAEILIRNGLAVYAPYVDDATVNLIVRVADGDVVRHVEIRIKEIVGDNRIFGVSVPAREAGDFILVLHARDAGQAEELFYLTGEQLDWHVVERSHWTDVLLTREDRAGYAHQTIEELARKLGGGPKSATPRQIQRSALQYTVQKLGMAFRVGPPERQDENWMLVVYASDETTEVGRIYVTDEGEVIASASATYDSVRANQYVACTEAPAA